LIDSLSSVLRLHQHSIGYMGDGFYRSKDPTSSIKVLKERTVQITQKYTIIRHINTNTANHLVYTNMGWLGDGSHTRQVRQAWTAVGLPLRYPYAGQIVVWVGTVDSQQFLTYFHPKWLLNGVRKCGVHLRRLCLNSDDHVKYSRRCHTKYPLPWLSAWPHSTISHHQYFNSMATITRGRLNWPSSMVVIFQRCSATFKFSAPSADGCIWWGTVPVNICQTFMKVVGRPSNVTNLITVQYSYFAISHILHGLWQ